MFVAAISVVTHNLLGVHDEHLDHGHAWLYPLELVPIWWIWASQTLFANRFDTDGHRHRMANLTIMLLMATMATFLGGGWAYNVGGFLGFYVGIRMILAGLYMQASRHHAVCTRFARKMSLAVVVGTAISTLSLFLDSPWREVVFQGGIAIEMICVALWSKDKDAPEVHKEHLIERAGLLSIIMLGESVINLVSALREHTWDAWSLSAAVTGFVMLGSLWWIYFDTYDRLGHTKRLRNGLVVLYSHCLFILGLGILASMIAHAVRNDIVMVDYRILAISGMTLFYLGKQIQYYVAFPPFRRNILINTIVCIGITTASAFAPRPELALMGASAGLLFYVFSNVRWTLKKDVFAYLTG